MNNFAQTIKGFLFDHKNTKQIIAKNAFWIGLAEFVPYILKFFLAVFMARILGADNYGAFTFAFAFASFFLVVNELGFNNIIIREFSKDPSQERYFPSLLTLKILLGLLAFLITVFGSFLVTHDNSVRLAILILAVYIFLEGLASIVYAFFNARQRMEYNSVGVLFKNILLAGMGFWVLFSIPSVENISLVYPIATFLTLIFLFLILKRLKIAIWPSFNTQIWKRFISMSWPVALSGMGGMIITNVDSITLGVFGQIIQNGWYKSAYSIFGVMFVPMYIVGQAIFPTLSRFFKDSTDKFQKIYNFLNAFAIFLAFGFLAGTWALAYKVIDYLYDPSFAPAVLSLQILSVAAVASFLALPLNTVLIVANLQQKVLNAMLAGALTNLILDIILIPQFSLYGTAIATFAAYCVIWLLMFKDVSKEVPINVFNKSLLFTLMVAVISAVLMYNFLKIPALTNFHVLILIILGGLVYSAAFLSLISLGYKKYFQT